MPSAKNTAGAKAAIEIAKSASKGVVVGFVFGGLYYATISAPFKNKVESYYAKNTPSV